MKLIESLTEKRIRAEIENSQEALLTRRSYPRLLSRLQEVSPAIESALILEWTPEQLEDIYQVLLNGKGVVTVEVPKSEEVGPLAVEPAEQYARKLKGRVSQIQFAVAMDLAKTKRSVR